MKTKLILIVIYFICVELFIVVFLMLFLFQLTKFFSLLVLFLALVFINCINPGNNKMFSCSNKMLIIFT